MSKVIHIKKGLKINLQGKPERIFHRLSSPKRVAIKPTDFVGLIPKLLVKEGDSVKAGEALFYDKNNKEIVFTSPVSGTVELINRGERRRLLEVVIVADEEISYKTFDIPSASSLGRDEIVSLMLESGLWPFIKQRPFSCIANPNDVPKSIHISCFDSSPLAPDYTFLISEFREEFAAGVKILQKLTDGETNLNVYDEIRVNSPFEKIEGVTYNRFTGKHPAGNVGIQIHHLDPINKGDVVWTVSPQDIVLIGRFFATGNFDARKVVVLTGNVKKPYYYKTFLGVEIASIAEAGDLHDNARVISGNVLTGSNVGAKGYLGFYDSQITIIEEGCEPEFLGWIMPGLKKFSMSRTFFSWLNPKKQYALNTCINGGERPFVFTGNYEKVLPMNIYPIHLLKSIIVNDIDQMEQLGIYEVAEEDFALCEFICPSKIEIQSIIRQGLDTIKKEFS